MLLPHLVDHDDVQLAQVITTTSLSASNAQRKFGFGRAGTDVDAMLADPGIDAVFVVTRHNSHAELTSRALRAGKAVFVEKPLALDEQELETVRASVESSGNDRLQVGFNRRFAPLLRTAKRHLGRRVAPATVHYLVNAGRLEPASWYRRAESEGSRFVGEGGHFIDTVGWLLDSEPVTVFASATPEQHDLHVTLRHRDGSTSVITYATTGAASFPKETLDLLADGKVLHLDDFTRATVHGRKRWTSPRIRSGRDKGQRAELAAFVAAVRDGGPMPIGLESLIATTRATIAVHASLRVGAPVELAPGRLATEPANGVQH
jgi:predicted dehydrogenase